MWVRVLVLENLGVLLDRSSTVEYGGLHIGHILAESCVFVLDLVCKLSGMAHDENGGFTVNGLNLLETGKDENGGFTKTRFGLAENIGS